MTNGSGIASGFRVASVVAEETAADEIALQKKLKSAGQPEIRKVLELAPQSRQGAGFLYLLTSIKVAAERVQLLNELITQLRKDLPALIGEGGKLPLRFKHFGFSEVEGMVQFIAQRVATMETGAKSVDEFVRNISGWEGLIAGILFERLVKYHPGLDGFFRDAAGEWIDTINTDVLASKTAGPSGRPRLLDINGNEQIVATVFKDPLKVVEAVLIYPDGTHKAFYDFGFIATNTEDLVANLPIELKLPIALAEVAAQMAAYPTRLAAAAKMVVTIVDKMGGEQKIEIDPSKLIFLEESRHQMAVAPYVGPRKEGDISVKAFRADAEWKELVAGIEDVSGKVPVEEVGTVTYLKPAISKSNEIIYWKARVLIARGWLEQIVQTITKPASH